MSNTIKIPEDTAICKLEKNIVTELEGYFKLNLDNSVIYFKSTEGLLTSLTKISEDDYYRSI